MENVNVKISNTDFLVTIIYRAATLSTLYLIVSGINIPSLKSIFWCYPNRIFQN